MHMSSAWLVAIALLSTACQGKGPEPTPANASKSAGKSDMVKKEMPVGADDGGTAKARPTDPPSEPSAVTPAQPPGDAEDPLGQRFLDPSWFRKELFPDAKEAKVSRSQRNEQGLFSSQILFDLPAGTTAEQCAKTLMDAVGKDVANLKRAEDAKQAGRLQMSGTTDRYRVTMMCGDAKGTMRAYVSFEWTS